MPQKNIPMEPTAEEKAAELAVTQPVKEDEVRAKVIAEFGFNEVDDAERIDKLVKKEVENHQKLSTAIGQKIKYRTTAEELSKKIPPTPPPAENKIVPPVEDISKVVAEQLEKRDLESLEYAPEIKKEIERIAKVQGISVKQAARDPYIVYKIGEAEKEQKASEASISRTNRSTGKKNYSFDKPPEIDVTTKEGREEWEKYKADMIKEGY